MRGRPAERSSERAAPRPAAETWGPTESRHTPTRHVSPAVQLQRAVGNQAVSRMLGAGGEIGLSRPSDSSERRAHGLAPAIAGEERGPPVGSAGLGRAGGLGPVAASLPGPGLRADVAGALAAVSGGGQPLPAGVRTQFEPGLGRELSGVRIHTDMAAASAALRIGAAAYTVGNDIAFAPGRYAPETSSGRLLLAHELVHAAQQAAQPPPYPVIQRQQAATAIPTPRPGPTGPGLKEFAAFEREMLGGVIPALPSDLRTFLAGLNLEVGFMTGVVTGIEPWIDQRDLQRLSDGFMNPLNALAFDSGIKLGTVYGLAEDIYLNLEGIWDLGVMLWTLMKSIPPEYLAASLLGPVGWTAILIDVLTKPSSTTMVSEIATGLWEFRAYIQTNPDALLAEGEQLGLVVGRELGEWLYGHLIHGTDYFQKGQEVGRLTGILTMEILLTVLAPEAWLLRGAALGARGASAAGRAAALGLRGSRIARRILSLMDDLPGLARIRKLFAQAEAIAPKAADVAKAGGAVTPPPAAVTPPPTPVEEAGKTAEAVTPPTPVEEAGKTAEAVTPPPTPVEEAAKTGEAVTPPTVVTTPPAAAVTVDLFTDRALKLLDKVPDLRAKFVNTQGSFDALVNMFRRTGSGGAVRPGQYLPVEVRSAGPELKTLLDYAKRKDVLRIELIPSSSAGRTPDMVVTTLMPDGTTRVGRVEITTLTGASPGYKPLGTGTAKQAAAEMIAARVRGKIRTTPTRPSQLTSTAIAAPPEGTLVVHLSRTDPHGVDNIRDAMNTLAPELATSPHVLRIEFYVPGAPKGSPKILFDRQGTTFLETLFP